MTQLDSLIISNNSNNNTEHWGPSGLCDRSTADQIIKLQDCRSTFEVNLTAQSADDTIEVVELVNRCPDTKSNCF